MDKSYQRPSSDEMLTSAKEEVSKLNLPWGEWCLGQPGRSSTSLRFWSLNKNIDRLQRLYVGLPEQYGLVSTATPFGGVIYLAEENKTNGTLPLGVPTIGWVPWREGVRAFWKLQVNEIEEVLLTKFWDDKEGFAELVELLKDVDLIQEMVSLANPEAGRRVYAENEWRASIRKSISSSLRE